MNAGKTLWLAFALLLIVTGLSAILLPAVGDALRPSLETVPARPAALRPGQVLASSGLARHHPVVIIPGIVSTGLEVWQAQPCMRSHFRERVWGGPLMVQKLLTHNACWLQHMLLNETTGMDPAGVQLRPAMGIGAADVMMGAYSLWGPLVRNLADLGYDAQSVHMASYDWRLAPWDLQRRDSYFTTLKLTIEMMVQVNGGRPAIITAHSMGGNVLQYFLQWVASPEGAAIGRHMPCEGGTFPTGGLQGRPCSHPDVLAGWWVELHVASAVYVAAPMLGVPKTVASLLSGETRESVSMPPLMRAVKSTVLSDKDTRRLFRSWSALTTMLPLGGDAVWGKPSVPHVGSAGSNSSSPRLDPRLAAPDQVAGHVDYGAMLTVHARDYTPEGASGAAVAASGQALRRLALRVQNETAQLADSLHATLVAGGVLGEVTQGAPDLDPPCDDVEVQAAAQSEVGVPPSVPRDCVTFTQGPGESDPDWNRTEALLDCAARLQQAHTLGSPLPMDWDLFDLDTSSLPLVGVGGPGVGGSAHTWTSATPDGTYVETPTAAHYSVEGVLRLMAAQSPRFMHKAVSNIALTAAWPPSSAAMEAGAHGAAAAGGNVEDAWMTAKVPKDTLAEHVPASQGPWRGGAGGLPRPYWMNPLSAPLPPSPSLRIFSVYGTGQLAERGYEFEGIRAPPTTKWHTAAVLGKQVGAAYPTPPASGDTETATGLPPTVLYPVHVATSVHAPDAGVSSGVLQSSGDSAVPIASLAYMCAKGWGEAPRNPATVPCVTREYTVEGGGEETAVQAPPPSGGWSRWMAEVRAGLQDRDPARMLAGTQALVREVQVASLAATTSVLAQWAVAVSEEGLLRGGVDILRAGSAEAGDHVDVLLNRDFITDLLTIAAGEGQSLSSTLSPASARVVQALHTRLARAGGGK